MDPKSGLAGGLNQMQIVEEEALSSGRQSAQQLKDVDHAGEAGKEEGEQEVQEGKFEEEKEDDEEDEEKQQELDRGKISTREIKRRGQLDVSDQATELDV